MDIITLDFETYYDRKYSLSKLTTEEYIRDEKFEVIGVGIKRNDSKTIWVPAPMVEEVLNKFDWGNSALLAHNTVFDGTILKWHYDITPKLYLDTLSMARPKYAMTTGVSLAKLCSALGLGQKGTEVVDALGKRYKDFYLEDLVAYGRYCVNDVDLTYKLYNTLIKKFPPSELLVIDTALRMFIDPVVVPDKKLLSEALVEIQNKKAELLDKCGADKTTLMSNQKFAQELTKRDVKPPKKMSPTTHRETFAFSKTDKQFTDLLKHRDPQVRALVEARLAHKSTLEETRTKKLLDIGHRGALPIMLNYYGAHTGRFSGGDKMNLQNFPRGGTLRKALTAPEGYYLFACDLSQIEARIVAWLAGQKDLLESFAEGQDVYSVFATRLYGRKITKENKLERFVGKTCILGLGYGMGAERYQESLSSGIMGMAVEVDTIKAKSVVNTYRQTYSRIPILWNHGDAALRGMAGGLSGSLGPLTYSSEGIEMPNKMLIRYPRLGVSGSSRNYSYCSSPVTYMKELKEAVSGAATNETEISNMSGRTFIYGAKVIENVTQGLARIVVTEMMLKLRSKYKAVLQVHDEIVYLIPEDQIEEAEREIIHVMSTPPVWAPDLPVACEASYGRNYGDCK